MAIKEGSSNSFYRDINSLANEKKFPARLMFELTYKCNFRCLHCYVVPDGKKQELSSAQVFSLLDQLKSAGVFHIGFTGGEPLMREDIFEILEYARNCGFRISLLTNGLLIDKAAAGRIGALGTSLNRVDVSMLGARKDTFEKITGTRGSFERVLYAIKLLKKERVDVQLKSTLLSLNKDEFHDIKKLASDTGCMFRYGTSVSRKTDGDAAPLKYRVSPEEICRIKSLLSSGYGAVDETRLNASARPGRKRLFHCGAGSSEATISPYGELNFCLEIHYPGYNILETSFTDCWARMKKLVEDIEIPPEYACGTCEVASFCRWCPAKAWLLNRDFFRCDKESREMALAEAGFRRGRT